MYTSRQFSTGHDDFVVCRACESSDYYINSGYSAADNNVFYYIYVDGIDVKLDHNVV